MSIEALAMAGVDYREYDISFQEMEVRDIEATPKYLLAEKSSNRKNQNKTEVVKMFNLQRMGVQSQYGALGESCCPAKQEMSKNHPINARCGGGNPNLPLSR